MEQRDASSRLSLAGGLRRRWWVVLIVALVTVGAAVGVSLLQEPTYTAETEVVVSQVRRTEDVSLEELVASNSLVQTQRQVVTSRPVADRVIEELGLQTAPSELVRRVTVTAVAETKVLRIEASGPDPRAAAGVADAFAKAYLEFRRDQAVDDLVAAQDAMAERAQELRGEIDSLEEEIEKAGPGQRAALTAERDALLTRLRQITSQNPPVTDAREAIRGGGSVLSPAEVPEEPASPRPIRNGALATVLGLMLGGGLAVLLDSLDDVIRGESDLQQATDELPVLGRIPHWDGAGDAEPVTLADAAAPAAEAYRALSLNVRFLLVPGDAGGGAGDGSLTVTSPAPQEGKTATACNLAVATARSGMTVVLVDADLRQPMVAERFGCPGSPGLADLLVTGPDALLDRHLVSIGGDREGEGGLWVLPAGTRPPNPAELLASRSMDTVHEQLAARADVVIYDTSPVLAVADPLELARRSSRTLVVVRAGQSSREDLRQGLDRVRTVGGRPAGSVLNDLGADAGVYDYYDYYGTADTPDGGGPTGWVARERPLPGGPGAGEDGPRGDGQGPGRSRNPVRSGPGHLFGE